MVCVPRTVINLGDTKGNSPHLPPQWGLLFLRILEDKNINNHYKMWTGQIKSCTDYYIRTSIEAGYLVYERQM